MGLLFKYSEPFIGVWKIQENTEELLSMLDWQEFYVYSMKNMKTEKRKKEWLAVRVLLKELLGEEALIAYSPNGAPYLPDHNLYISISHTKGYVAVILCEHCAVGVDIEYRGERIVKVRHKFMTQEEESTIDKSHETEHLLIYWCAKETLFKMIGQENVDFRQHLHIYPFKYYQSGYLTASESRTNNCKVFKFKFVVENDYVLTYSI